MSKTSCIRAGRRSAAFLLSIAVLSAGPLRPAAAVDKPIPPQVLVDFEDPADVLVRPSEAKARIVPSNGGHALQIETKAEASYPSVLLVSKAGKWDLSAWEGLEMDVLNPQDGAVRVLLGINNPGANGVNGCNVESANIKARGKGRVLVPFGQWHGQTGRDLDLKNVVSISILLDRPGKSHVFIVDNIRAVRLDGGGERFRDDPFFRQMTSSLGRGINLGNALEAPNEGEWGVKLRDEFFVKIREAGFDSVRIPVRWSNHAGHAEPYTIDPKFFARVDWAVAQALKNRLVPVLNMHHYDEIYRDPDGHRKRFIAMWRQISEHYSGQPAALLFELLNEPNGKLNSDKWNPMLAEAIAVVRRTNPVREIVVGPTDWNSINDLDLLELPANDRRLIVTVHYYSPFQFTHQGASWAGPQSPSWLGTRWTGSVSERKAVLRDFNKAVNWAVEHRRPLYLGEFGAYSKADMESRARWTRFVAQTAQERKMSFAYWEFCSVFGAYDPNRNEWIQPIKDAILGAK